MHAKIEGDDEIKRKIKELASKFPDKLRGVMTKSVLVVENRAKKLVPVVTGRLRASITHEVFKSLSGYSGRVGTNVEYAPSVEFGGGAKKVVKTVKTKAGKDFNIRASGKAKPYLFPALKESKGDIIGFLTSAIKGIK